MIIFFFLASPFSFDASSFFVGSSFFGVALGSGSGFFSGGLLSGFGSGFSSFLGSFFGGGSGSFLGGGSGSFLDFEFRAASSPSS